MISLMVSACNANGSKLVILMDEFQRAAGMSTRARTNLMAYLRTLFNKNSKGLSVVLAVTSGLRENAMGLLSGELRTILGPKPGISLPELTPGEAITFCERRLLAYRPQDYSGEAFGPFSRETIEEMVESVSHNSDLRLIPRTLIQEMSLLMEELQVQDFKPLTPDDVKRIFRQRIESNAIADSST
jgi:hypothetical protein